MQLNLLPLKSAANLCLLYGAIVRNKSHKKKVDRDFLRFRGENQFKNA